MDYNQVCLYSLCRNLKPDPRVNNSGKGETGINVVQAQADMEGTLLRMAGQGKVEEQGREGGGQGDEVRMRRTHQKGKYISHGLLS